MALAAGRAHRFVQAALAVLRGLEQGFLLGVELQFGDLGLGHGAQAGNEQAVAHAFVEAAAAVAFVHGGRAAVAGRRRSSHSGAGRETARRGDNSKGGQIGADSESGHEGLLKVKKARPLCDPAGFIQVSCVTAMFQSIACPANARTEP
ncbi:hypothetical protein D3C72_1634150 [compost metagenome]